MYFVTEQMFKSLKLTDEQQRVTIELMVNIGKLLQEIVTTSKEVRPTQVTLPSLDAPFIQIKKSIKPSELPIEKIWLLLDAIYDYLSLFRLNSENLTGMDSSLTHQRQKIARFTRLFHLLNQLYQHNVELLGDVLKQSFCYYALICIFAELDNQPKNIDADNFLTVKTFLLTYTVMDNCSLDSPFLLAHYIQNLDSSIINQAPLRIKNYLMACLHSMLAINILSACKHKATQNELLQQLNSKTNLIEISDKEIKSPAFLHLSLLIENWLVLRSFSVVNSDYLSSKNMLNALRLKLIEKIIEAFDLHEESIPPLDDHCTSCLYILLEDMMKWLTHNNFQHPSFYHLLPSQLANIYGRIFLLPRTIPLHLLNKYSSIVPPLLHFLQQQKQLRLLYHVIDVVDSIKPLIQRVLSRDAILSNKWGYYLKLLHWLEKNKKNGLEDFEQVLKVDGHPLYNHYLFNTFDLSLGTYAYCFFTASYLLKIAALDKWPSFQSFITNEMSTVEMGMAKKIKDSFSAFLEVMDVLYTIGIRKNLPDKKYTKKIKASPLIFSELALNRPTIDFFKNLLLDVLVSSLESFGSLLDDNIGNSTHQDMFELYITFANLFNELNVSETEQQEIKKVIRFEQYLSYKKQLELQLIRFEEKPNHTNDSVTVSKAKTRSRHRKGASKTDVAVIASLPLPSLNNIDSPATPPVSATKPLQAKPTMEVEAVVKKEKLWPYFIEHQERIANECQRLYSTQAYSLQKKELPKRFNELCVNILEHLGVPLILTGSAIVKVMERKKLTDLDCILFNVDLNRLQPFLFKLGVDKVSNHNEHQHSLLKVIIEEFEKTADGRTTVLVSRVELDIVSKTLRPGESILEALREDAKRRDLLSTTMHVICGNEEKYPLIDSLGAYAFRDMIEINPHLYDKAQPAAIFINDPPRLLRLINAHLASPHKFFGEKLREALGCLFAYNHALHITLWRNFLLESQQALLHQQSFITKIAIITHRHGLNNTLKALIQFNILPLLCQIDAHEFFSLLHQSQQLEQLLQINEVSPNDYDPYLTLYLLVLTFMHQLKRHNDPYLLPQTLWYQLAPKPAKHQEMINQWQDKLEHNHAIDFKKFPLLKWIDECTSFYRPPQQLLASEPFYQAMPPISSRARIAFFPQPKGDLFHPPINPSSEASFNHLV